MFGVVLLEGVLEVPVCPAGRNLPLTRLRHVQYLKPLQSLYSLLPFDFPLSGPSLLGSLHIIPKPIPIWMFPAKPW